MTNLIVDLGKESRLSRGFELRRASDGDSHLVNFRGYASVSEHPYSVYGGPDEGGWSETVTRGAWKRTLGMGDNRALLYAHDHAQVLGTTRSGSVRFEEDKVGLLVDGQLDTRVSWINDLVQQIDANVVDEMSVGFYARAQSWSKDYTQRAITEAQLIEATIVWAGANGATVASIDRNKQLVMDARSKAAMPSGKRVALAAAAAAAALNI